MLTTKTNSAFLTIAAMLAIALTGPAGASARPAHHVRGTARLTHVTPVMRQLLQSRVALRYAAQGTTGTSGPTSSARAVKGLGGPVITLPAGNVATTDLQAGGAGVPGYGDKECEALVQDFNKAVDRQEQGLLTGNEHEENYYGSIAKHILNQMEDNCIVVF